MPWLSLTPIIIWAAISIPLFILLWYIHPKSKLNVVLVWLAYALWNIFCFMTINWVIFNYWLRFMALALPFFTLLRWLKPLRVNPRWPNRSILSGVGLVVVLALIAFPAYLLVGVFRATSINNVEIVPMLSLYPIRTGLYVVGNGGNGLESSGLNGYVKDWLGQPTGRNEEMTFAVTFYEMRTNGTIADSTFSEKNPEYEIFTEPVYAPCPGTVVSVVQGFPDVTPLAKAEAPADMLGNRVVIQCTEFFVTVANLRRISVETGEQITFNRLIGQAGNSASESLPSVTMYVTTADGSPVPILFEAGIRFRFVSRNFIFVR